MTTYLLTYRVDNDNSHLNNQLIQDEFTGDDLPAYIEGVRQAYGNIKQVTVFELKTCPTCHHVTAVPSDILTARPATKGQLE